MGSKLVLRDRLQQEIDAVKALNNGKCLPQHLIDRARSKDSHIHDLFEWNDGEAAEKFRILQAARYLLIKVEVLARDNKFLNIKIEAVAREGINEFRTGLIGRETKGGSGYRAIDDEKEEQKELARALSDLRKWSWRYQHLLQLNELVLWSKVAELEENMGEEYKHNPFLYCQNIKCPLPEKKFPETEKVTVEIFADTWTFCSDKCKIQFLDRGSKDTRDEDIGGGGLLVTLLNKTNRWPIQEKE